MVEIYGMVFLMTSIEYLMIAAGIFVLISVIGGVLMGMFDDIETSFMVFAVLFVTSLAWPFLLLFGVFWLLVLSGSFIKERFMDE
jgi:hypothetical protein